MYSFIYVFIFFYISLVIHYIAKTGMLLESELSLETLTLKFYKLRLYESEPLHIQRLID